MISVDRLDEFNLPSPLQAFSTEWIDAAGIHAFIKRDDLIHPFLSGNKWRKLKYNIKHFLSSDYDCLRTFGGAFSNHLHAVAWAGRHFSFETAAFVRGEMTASGNPTLSFAQAHGMQLTFIDRQQYRQRNDDEYLRHLQSVYPDSLFIPEGGSNVLSMRGTAELTAEIHSQHGDTAHWIVPVGSAGTLAGLVAAAPASVTIHGIAVIKGGEYLHQEVQKLLLLSGNDRVQCNYIIHPEFHFGGYARFDPELIQFMTQYWQQTGVQLEPVYSGKAMFGFHRLVQAGVISRGSDAVFIHTGGLQGLAGLRQKFPDQFQHDAFKF